MRVGRAIRWLTLLVVWTAGRPVLAVAQTLEVRPEQTKGTIGDPITLRLTVRLPPGMQLIDVTPHTLVPPPKGIRVLSADTLRPSGGGTYTGRARVAFYRIGPQPVPTLALLYRSGPGEPPDTLVHLPVSVEITPILEPGNPALRDIKPLQPIGGPVWGPLAILFALIGGGFWWLRVKGRSGAPTGGHVPALEAGPFDVALARLELIGQTARASGNGVIPLYAGLADVVRDCLLEVGAIPHRGVTTPELGGALPPQLAAGDLRGRCESMLGDADLVKFANVKPDFAAAEGQLEQTRALLEAWRRAVEMPDAIR